MRKAKICDSLNLLPHRTLKLHSSERYQGRKSFKRETAVSNDCDRKTMNVVLNCDEIFCSEMSYS